MGKADNPAFGSGQFPGAELAKLSSDAGPSADVVILGGGVMGLWAALKAARLGLKTILVEAAMPGAGASGGLLGALMPHMPDRWNDKKQFQFDALIALEGEVAALEEATGLSAGYRRCGRLIPLPKPHLRDIALRHSTEAITNWNQHGCRFDWHVLDAPPLPGWPDPAACGNGVVHDTLAARISPRRLVAALTAALAAHPLATILAGRRAVAIDPAAATVSLEDGIAIGFGHCIVAAGHRSFPLLEQISPPLAKPLGQPVKGQAALLRADVDSALPVIFLNGLYVVAHEDGHVAIGSTSEDVFDAPYSTDGQLDDLIDRARDLVPALADAVIAERWAGLRPKAVGRDPMVGPHPDHRNVIALSGGFKVSFGLAHKLADAALQAVKGEDIGVPASFLLAGHVAVSTR